MKRALSRFMKWLSPAGRVDDVEAGSEFALSNWVGDGSHRGAGDRESYELGFSSGVRVFPAPVKGDTPFVISYSGDLVKQGATAMYVHCGDGPGSWENVREIPMEFKTDTGEWVAEVHTLNGEGTVEFCFRDDDGNWDNNTGRNWRVSVIT